MSSIWCNFCVHGFKSAFEGYSFGDLVVGVGIEQPFLVDGGIDKVEAEFFVFGKLVPVQANKGKVLFGV